MLLVDVRDAEGVRHRHLQGRGQHPDQHPRRRTSTRCPRTSRSCSSAAPAGAAARPTTWSSCCKPEMKTYFLNADIKWAKDGSYTIAEIK
ncbi:MAG: hypothetical protein MZV65_29280 [Chromatiales bacterium]|nr:hypothetical protein [Chromatiales bacterium]